MKNSKKILACTLGLMLSAGILVGCGGNGGNGEGSNETYTVTFYNGNEKLKTETVKAGEKCPEYVPDAKTDYTFVGWYTSRSVRNDETKFSFDTPINEDYDLYAWYKQNFAASTDVFYIVGSFEDGDWDGGAGAEVPADRTLTHNSDTENEKNVYEYTINAIYKDEKFRLIKSTDGLVSDGWVDDYGFDLVSKVIGADGNEINKSDAITEQDSKNIGVLFNAKLKVTYTMESDYSPNGEIVLTILENLDAKGINKVSVIGGTGNDWADTYYLTSEDKVTWTIENATLEEGFTWKLRADEDWKASWGYSAIESAPEGAFEEGQNGDGQNNGNIVTKVSGTYNISFNYETGKITITAADPTPDPVTGFTITPDKIEKNDTTGSGYSSYNGDHTFDDITITTSNVLIGNNIRYNNETFIQFKASEGYITYNGTIKSVTLVVWSSYDWKDTLFEISINGVALEGPSTSDVNANRTDTTFKSGTYTIYEYTYTISLETAQTGLLSIKNVDSFAAYAKSITIA